MIKKLCTLYSLVIVTALMTGCAKDQGNYTYEEINEVSIVDHNPPGIVYLGDTLIITPGLEATQAVDESRYSYSWINKGDEISTERNLKYLVTWNPGSYVIEFYVKDNLTDVTWQKQYPITVKTPVYEGYLVLCEENGSSRLDMLSYLDMEFIHYRDVLDMMGSSLKLKGRPVKVVSSRINSRPDVFPNYGIYLLTDEAMNQIDPETFDWNSLMDIRYQFKDNVPASFIPQNLFVAEVLRIRRAYLVAGNKLLFANSNAPFVYARGEDFSPYAPLMALTGENGVLYDENRKVFVNTFFGSPYDIDEELFPGYPQGFELISLFNNHYNLPGRDNFAYAVLKNAGNGDYKLFRFNVGEYVDYFRDMNAPELEHASHFAASPELDYLFYSVGGKVYQYDMGLQSAKLVLDLGSSDITLLQFTPFYSNSDLSGRFIDNYREWGKWLMVASNDPSKPAGESGALALYSVPPVSQPLVKQQEWNGFGKIVSVSYRERFN